MTHCGTTSTANAPASSSSDARICRRSLETASAPSLREIRVPTLVVCGEEDVITPPADAEALHAGIAGSALELIPKAGHLSNLEAPDAFNRVLEAFLRRVG